MKTFADAEQVLARSLPGYQSREPQQRLATFIHQSFRTGRHLIAEAGTGTGKSLAYLIESILCGRRVVISTATKALQDQLANKDIPFLAEHLGHPFTYAVLKGRGNYLCVERALTSEGVTSLRRILDYAEQAGEDFDGERDSFPFQISNSDWFQVAAESEECADNKCSGKRPEDHACYAQRARTRAEVAQIVVVNHSLFFSDIKVKQVTEGHANMLGNYDTVVFDEAHEMESYASMALGDRLTEGTFTFGFTQVRNAAQSFGFLDMIEPLIAQAMSTTQALWRTLEVGRIRPATMADHEGAWGDQFDAISAVRDAWNEHWQVSFQGLGEDDRKRGRRITRLLNNMVLRFGTFIAADWGSMVRFVVEERTRRGDAIKVLKTTPINVGPYLREHVFGDNPDRDPLTAVLVSATIAVNGTMNYIASRLGVDAYDELDVGTPFSYPDQARLYVPTDIPEPTPANRAAWGNLMRETLYDLVRASEGRALLLFTSFREMTAAYDSLSRRLPYTCLRQGQGANRDLVAQFAEETDSVLFATRSFFTGIDLQGETCSLVTIDKMPFPVPTDPVVEARQEEIERNGGSSFADYAVPEMTLPLKQGVGRLIRHANDRGVFAILDPRLVTKGYGRKIIKSLPEAPLVTDLEEIKGFFREVVNEGVVESVS